MREIKYVNLPNVKLRKSDDGYTSLMRNYLDKNRPPILFMFAAAVAAVHISINVCKELDSSVNLPENVPTLTMIANSIGWDINETFSINTDLFKSMVSNILSRMYPVFNITKDSYDTFDSIFGNVELVDESLNALIEANSWMFSDTIVKIRQLYKPVNVTIDEYSVLTSIRS